MEAKAITAIVCSRGESLTHHKNQMSEFQSAVISAAGVCVILATGIFAYDRFGLGEEGYIESYCNVSRVNDGKCTFTVEDKTSGRECVIVSLTNKNNQSKKSEATVCSGLVGPMESKNVEFLIDIEEPCGDDWDNCELDVKSKERVDS